MTRLRRVAAIVAWGGCAWTGCSGSRSGSEPHVSVPVTGFVRLRNGTPLAQGFVQLEAVDGPAANVSGAVDAGRFALTTCLQNAVIIGAAPGRYRFLVTPAFQAEPRTVRFERTYDIGRSGTHVTLDLPTD